VDTIAWSPTKNLLTPPSLFSSLETYHSFESSFTSAIIKLIFKWIYIRADLSLYFDVLYKEQICLSHSSTKVKKKKNCLFFLSFSTRRSHHRRLSNFHHHRPAAHASSSFSSRQEKKRKEKDTFQISLHNLGGGLEKRTDESRGEVELR